MKTGGPYDLLYPDPTPLPAPAKAQIMNLQHYQPQESANYYPVLLGEASAPDLPFESGDEIALFANGPDGEFCVGATVWQEELPFAIMAWADDPLTEAKDGYTAGEPIIIKYWSAGEDQEYGLDADFHENASTYEFDVCSVADVTTLAVEDGQVESFSFVLAQNYPNPFNPHTAISYEIPAAGRVSLRIFNAAGQLIRTLVDGEQQPGLSRVDWDGRNDNGSEVASGIYFYRLETTGHSDLKKMVLLR